VRKRLNELDRTQHSNTENERQRNVVNSSVGNEWTKRWNVLSIEWTKK